MSFLMLTHQYIDRSTGQVRTEQFVGDAFVRWLYSDLRENARFLFRALTGRRFTSVLGRWRYDPLVASRRISGRRLFADLGADPSECLQDPERLDTPRKVFERRIRYWECRPMPTGSEIVVAPADSRVLLGTLIESSQLFVKRKFFDLAELLGAEKGLWLERFAGAHWAIFRLTPELYHYVHTPVAGRVEDFYAVEGACHACNPFASVREASLLSKNSRMVTILQTDVEGGTGASWVAMIEIVALMVGGIEQCYSAREYDDPQPIRPGLMLARGAPKARFRPGSSTVVLLFQPGRVRFDMDLVRNQRRVDVSSRFSEGLGRSVVETAVRVRSSLGTARRLAE